MLTNDICVCLKIATIHFCSIVALHVPNTAAKDQRSYLVMVGAHGSPGQKNDGSFITEVPRLGSASSRQRSQRNHNSLVGVTEKDEHGIRGAERIDAKTTAADVFRLTDKFGEKQQHSKNIRSMIQKAAQKTILVVRTKNATQAAENVTIRFSKNNVTEVPRSVVLRDVFQRVLASISFSSARKRHLYFELFDNAPEIDSMLKDMFWYLTAHCFQSGRHKQLEENFYQRIADNFTSLFIRVQVQPSSRDSGFFDTLPDVLAQILFMALYEGFPKSRKSMTGDSIRKDILRICYCWILGFVPAVLDWSHWVPVDQESPKRIAALADFPAMRNRMVRAERIERTKIEVKNRHSSVFDEHDDRGELDAELSDSGFDDRDKLPVLQSGHHPHSTNGLRVETHERCVYQMQNSPLVDAFLKRHHLEANASHLKVQLRMTSGKHFDLSNQEALHATTLPCARRRRLVNPKSYAEALENIDAFGDSVRTMYASTKKKMRDHDVMERRILVQEQRELESQFSELRHQSTKMHEFSNIIASKARIDALGPRKDKVKASTKGSATATILSSPRAGPSNLIPRPPPPRS